MKTSLKNQEHLGVVLLHLGPLVTHQDDDAAPWFQSYWASELNIIAVVLGLHTVTLFLSLILFVDFICR